LLLLQLPPKGVEWEISYRAEGELKWINLVAPKEYDNLMVPRLLPGGLASFVLVEGGFEGFGRGAGLCLCDVCVLPLFVGLGLEEGSGSTY
jgi:hypothetical protein